MFHRLTPPRIEGLPRLTLPQSPLTLPHPPLQFGTKAASLRTAVEAFAATAARQSAVITGAALDKETITYPGGFTRVLDRNTPSLGRPTGWQLGMADTNGALASAGVETAATYGYSETTGRLETVSGNSSGTFTYAYETNSGLIKTVSRPGILAGQPALRVTNTWEPARDVLLTKANERVLGETVTDVSSITYTVNALGQRTHATRTGAATNGTEWAYDTLGQLTSADDDTTAAHDRGYLYDSIGNRRGIRNGAVGIPLNGDGTIKENEGTLAYSANLLNQYNATPHATVPVHDDDGNMTSGDLQSGAGILPASLTWDAENRLTSVTVNGTTITYAYDAFSRRISRSVGVSPTTTTLYFYDAWNCIAEYQLQNSSFNLHTSYLWGPDLSGSFQGAGGVGGLLSVNRIGSPMAYPGHDGNGNITEYLGADGTVLAHFEYDPFGNTVASTDTANQFEYRFSTKSIDSTTGLYYYGNRWYDPFTGRWPSRDPIGERGGVNLYGFLYNSTPSWIDRQGMDPIPPFPDDLEYVPPPDHDLPAIEPPRLPLRVPSIPIPPGGRPHRPKLPHQPVPDPNPAPLPQPNIGPLEYVQDIVAAEACTITVVDQICPECKDMDLRRYHNARVCVTFIKIGKPIWLPPGVLGPIQEGPLKVILEAEAKADAEILLDKAVKRLPHCVKEKNVEARKSRVLVPATFIPSLVPPPIS